MKETFTLKYSNDRVTGLILLALNIVVSVTSQFLLKMSMLNLGSFTVSQSWDYLISMVNLPIISGLLLYGAGTILWLLCLKRLDLGFAYPVATMQYIFVFAGAWYLFDESINWMRLTGLGVICVGVILMSLDLRQRKE